MREKALVLKTNGSRATISVLRHVECKNCGQCNDKGASVFDVHNDKGVSQGQIVEIEMNNAGIMVAALLAYLFPVVFMIIGYLVGMLFSSAVLQISGEWIRIVFSIGFLLLAFLILRIINTPLGKTEVLTPKIVRVLYDER